MYVYYYYYYYSSKTSLGDDLEDVSTSGCYRVGDNQTKCFMCWYWSLQTTYVHDRIYTVSGKKWNFMRHCSVHAVASRSCDISTCVNKGGVTHCKHWLWVKLVIITFISTFTTAVDDSTICTELCFCAILSLFWCCCVTAMRAFHF